MNHRTHYPAMDTDKNTSDVLPLNEILAGDCVEAMNRFANTDGLIIDIRTNSGGSRAPLRVLFPFFLAENDLPRIVNVAAYRLGVKDRKEAFEGRYLYPVASPNWSEAERAVIKQFASTFEPEWVLPEGEFSEWHYFVISPFRDQGYFHYDKPVVILMDRWNFSACDIFLGAFKGWKNVTFGDGCVSKDPNDLVRGYEAELAEMGGGHPTSPLEPKKKYTTMPKKNSR